MFLLFVLLGAMMLLSIVRATGDAGATTWENDYDLDTTNGIEWEWLDTDGVNAFVAYTKEISGDPYSYMRYYNGVEWSTTRPVTGNQVLSRNVRVVAEDSVAHFVLEDWTDGDADVHYTSFNMKTGAWTRAMLLSSATPGVDAREPAIDLDDGTVHVVWYEDVDGDKDIYHRSGSGLTWSAAEEVSVDVGDENQTWPDVSAVGGEVHVVWRDMRRSDYDIFYRHYNGTWGMVTDVSLDDEDQISPRVVVSNMGVHVLLMTLEGQYWHTYMTTYTGVWSTPGYVGRARSSTSEDHIKVDAEEGNLVLMYRTEDVPNNVVLRRYTNNNWGLEQNVFASPSESFFGFDIDLADGVLHMAYGQFDPSQGPIAYRYLSSELNVADPWAVVEAVEPYWMDGSRTSLSWRAQDDYWLSSVTVQYRYSADNTTWDRWTVVRTQNASGYVASGSASFVPDDGDGFYEFKAYATDLAGKQEDPSTEPEAMGGLDTADPTGSVLIEGGDDYTQGPNVTLTVTYGDATSGVVNVRFAEEAIGGDEPWEDPVDTKEWDVGSESGLVTVCYQVMDGSGRLSQVYTDTITVDTDKPTGAIALATGATVVNTPNVTLSLSYDDATSPVVGIRVTEEAIGGDEPWENPVETMELTLSAGGGQKDVHFQVIDAAGHVSDVHKLTITLDVTNPFVETADPDDAEERVGVDADIVVRFSEPMDRTSVEAGFSLEYTKDGTAVRVAGTFNWSPDMRTVTYSPSADLEKGTEHTLSLTTGAKDQAGNGVFPAISYRFTTEKGASGNGGDGDDDGGSLLPIVVLVLVLVIVAVLGMVLYMKREGGPGSGKEQ